MKILLDFFPILLFFIAYKVYDIYVATAVAIVAAVAQVAWSWFRTRHVEKMHLVTMVMIVVLGGATLILHDDMFIKWKPSVVNWLFGIAFLISQFVGKKTIVERIMGANISLPNIVWVRLNWSWTIFFISIGILNLYVVYNFDENTWVNFKLFGMLGLTIAFIVGQGFYLARYIKSEPADPSDNQGAGN